jgi:hypothetical protein
MESATKDAELEVLDDVVLDDVVVDELEQGEGLVLEGIHNVSLGNGCGYFQGCCNYKR